MADSKPDSENKTDTKSVDQNKLAVVPVCNVSIPIIISSLHVKALAKAQEAVADCRVENSAIEADGKTAKLKSAGEHIISILAKDDQSKILKTDAVKALKEYVSWFVGPDLASKINDQSVVALALEGEVEVSKETGKPVGESSNKFMSFSEFLLLEADDDDDPDDDSEIDRDEDKNMKIDAARTGDDEDTDEVKAEDAPEETDTAIEAAGYYIAYNLKVEGLKQTALKDAMKKFAATFFDGVTITASGLFGGGQSFTVKDIKKAFKDVFGNIDPDELVRNINDKVTKKFPAIRDIASVSIWDKNSAILKLKGYSVDTEVKDAIHGADYSLAITADKSDAAKKFLNPRVVADIVTSSITGLYRKFKNKITKDQVFLIPGYRDLEQDSKEERATAAAEKKKILSIEQFDTRVDNASKTRDIKELKAVLHKYFIKELSGDKALDKSVKAIELVKMWKEFSGKHGKLKEKYADYENAIKAAYKAKYNELFNADKSDDDDDDDEVDESRVFTRQEMLQKLILEMLFETDDVVLEEGKLEDFITSKGLSKDDALKDENITELKRILKLSPDKTRARVEKYFAQSEASQENVADAASSDSATTVDDTNSAETNGVDTNNAETNNAEATNATSADDASEGQDLYIVPMAGLKYPDEEDR